MHFDFLIDRIVSDILKNTSIEHSILKKFSKQEKIFVFKEVIKIFFYNHILPFYSEKIKSILKETFEKNASELISEINELNKKEIFYSLLQKKKINEILSLLEKTGIEIIILKGIVLEELLYNGILRPSVDFDLLVRKSDKERIQNFLEKREFIPFRVSDHESFTHLRKTENKALLNFDIHTVLIKRDFFEIDENELFEKSLPFRCKNLRRLCNEDLLIHLIFHLVKQFYNCPIKNLLDIHLFIKKIKFDHNEVIKKIERMNAKTAFYLTLFLLKDRFGDEFETELLKKIKPSFLRRLYLEHFFKGKKSKLYRYEHPYRLIKYLLLLPLKDSNSERIKFLKSFLKRKIFLNFVKK